MGADKKWLSFLCIFLPNDIILTILTENRRNLANIVINYLHQRKKDGGKA